MYGTETLHYFDNITVCTELQPNGEYTAIDHENYDGPGSPMGWGPTPYAAIADLAEEIRERNAPPQHDRHCVDRMRHLLK